MNESELDNLDTNMMRSNRESYFAAKKKNVNDTEANRMSLAEFLLTENEEVTEKGAIKREQLAHFIDLTYVATIFNINHIINGCGDHSIEVNLLAISYFFILFTSRYHFDIYSIMFYSVDLVHRCLFLAFNLGIFVMTFNIKATVTGESSGHRLLATDDHSIIVDDHHDDHYSGTETTESGYNAGKCHLNIEYIQGFATGYLTSRITLILMYTLLIYFAYIHKERNSLLTYITKVIPLFIGVIVMIPIFWITVNPIKILFSVALIEILGDIIPEVTNHYLHKYKISMSNIIISMRPDVDLLQDRLQEFFLIVLGNYIYTFIYTYIYVSICIVCNLYIYILVCIYLVFIMGFIV